MKIADTVQLARASFVNKKFIRNSAKFLSVTVLGSILSLSPLAPLANFDIKFAEAANEVFTSPSDKTANAGEVISINDLQVNGDGNDVLNMTLYVSNGSLSFGDTTGLTFNGVNEGNNLKFTGTRSVINAALLTLEYTAPYTGGTYEIEALIDEGDGSVYRHANGHVYRVVEVEGGITWTAAKAAAEALTFPGTNAPLNGYLATIADVDENNFVLARIDQDGWIGASDDSDLTLGYEDLNEGNNEGEWFWVTGPEAGIKFWTGGMNGSIVGGQYANWNKVNPSNEPNNTGGAENCAEMRFSANGNGRWNDLPCGSTRPNYVVEFGIPGNDPIVKRATFDVTVAAPDFIPVEQCFTVTEPGLYGLTENITGVEGDCIVIESDDVVIEGNGFSITGTEDNYGVAIKSEAWYMDDRHNIEIRNVVIDNFETGVWTKQNDDVRINAITVTNTQSPLYVEGEQGEGFNHYDGVSITNSTFTNNGYAIQVEVMRNVTISGNEISGSLGEGIELVFVENVVVTENVITDPDYSGIFLQGVNDIEITHNTITGAENGVYSTDENSNVTVSHNEISNVLDLGLSIESIAGGIFEENTVSSTNSVIALTDSSDITVRNNSFTSEEGYVVSIYSSEGITLLENQIIGNAWVIVDEDTTGNIIFSQNGIGNSYFLLDGTPAWEIFDIKDNNNNGYADIGTDLPFAEGLSYSDDEFSLTLWEGLGQDNHPKTEVVASGGGNNGGGNSGGSSGGVIGSYTRATTSTQNTTSTTPSNSNEGQCSADMILTQNLKSGARNGKYHSYTKAVVTEVKILQTHMNRLGFNSGVVDGILGPITDGAIKRMQIYLGTYADGYVGPITRSLINKSCGAAGLQRS